MEGSLGALYPAGLEVRQEGGRTVIAGAFPYNRTATLASTGRVRKESFLSRAFAFAVNDTTREIHLLSGHDYSTPLASRRAGTLELVDSDTELRFEATLPQDESRWATWQTDARNLIEQGLMPGISPGFRVPPASAVANAESILPEPGNPGVGIRTIRQAVLFELSTVTRPAYDGTTLNLRADGLSLPVEPDPRLRLL